MHLVTESKVGNLKILLIFIQKKILKLKISVRDSTLVCVDEGASKLSKEALALLFVNLMQRIEKMSLIIFRLTLP